MKLINQYTCYSGGAAGADSFFEMFSSKYHVNVLAYSYKTKHHQSINKIELSLDEFKEGVLHVYKANEVLKRSKINQYLNLLARNWFQVKKADEIFAVSSLKEVDGSLRVKGGTAWAVQMAIDAEKKVYVFDQDLVQWFYYDATVFNFKPLKGDLKINSYHFAGIGTRTINLFGIDAIEQLYKNTFTNGK